MKKYLLGLVLIGAMVMGTTSALAGTLQKVAPKTEQTATMKKVAARKAKCDAKCGKNSPKVCCHKAPSTKKNAPTTKKVPAKK